MTALELAEWMAYFSLEPFGEDRADLRSAIVASTVANVHVSKKQYLTKPSDFMPYYETPKRSQTVVQQIGPFEQLASAVNQRKKR